MTVGFEKGHLKNRLILVYSVSTSSVIRVFMLRAEIEFAFPSVLAICSLCLTALRFIFANHPTVFHSTLRNLNIVKRGTCLNVLYV